MGAQVQSTILNILCLFFFYKAKLLGRKGQGKVTGEGRVTWGASRVKWRWLVRIWRHRIRALDVS